MGSVIDRKNSAPKRAGDRGGGSGGPARASSGKDGANRNVGAALRSVYQETINEDIPAEMLDLLGKLG